MADGSVNIDVKLNSDQAVAERNKIDELLKSLGDGAGDKIEPSIQSGLNKAQHDADNTHQQIVDRFGKPIKMPIDDSDTKRAEEKAKKLGKTYESMPKYLRTELIADAKDHGIANMDKMLRQMPKELRTELIAKAQKGEAIDYEKLLKRLPAKLLTQLSLTDNASPKLRAIQSEVRHTQRQFTGLRDIIKGTFVGGLFAQGAAMIGGALSSTAHEALSASDAIDKFKSTMKLGGFGSTEINRQAKEVQKYANDTVYDLNTISNTTAQLASNGVKGYMNLTEAAGNLNAQAGGTADTFRSVAMVLTQTAGAGKLTTENWNQLTDAIPGASGVLQRQMKKNGAYTGNFRDAMAKGQITADEFNKAITQLGMNKGAIDAAKSTTTFEGAFGNLEAQVVTGIQEMIQALGKRRMTDMINAATDAVLGLTNFVLKLFSAMAEHKDIAIGLGTVLAGVFATKKIADFIMWLGKAKDAMISFGIVSQAAGSGSSSIPAAGQAIAGGSRLAGLASFAGRAVPVAAATYAVGQEITGKGSAIQKAGGSVGAIGGAFGGRALGGAIGTMIAPGIGTAVGQMLGGTLGTWAGNKLGDAIGKAANKHMQGHSIVAHAKIKLDSDTRGTSKALAPGLKNIASTVIKMNVDPASIAQTKAKTNKMYDDLEKRLDKYYRDKESKSKKDLDVLVKSGQMSQAEENRRLAAEKKADDQRERQHKKSLERMRKDTNDHYSRLQKIQSGATKKMQQAEQKYGRNSQKYRQIQQKELEKENQRFAKQLVKDQTKNDKAIQASIKKGASEQEKILKDLRKKRGKLSLQDLKQTQRDANKQYEAAVRPARKARDEIIKAAEERYRKTKRAAEKEYKENHTISKKKYKKIVSDAKKQRDDTTAAAKDEYKKNTKSARKQHKEVTKEIDDQKTDVINAANEQATAHTGAAGNEMSGVNGKYSGGFGNAGHIWNSFLSGVKSVLKFFKASTKGMGSVPEQYAVGTGALQKAQVALVGEEGFELGYNPQQGYHVLGGNGPELRYLPQGESILTHAQSKSLMSMFGGRVPGYAHGTGTKITDFLKDGIDEAFDLVDKGASAIWNWLKEKTGLDRLLASQASMGGVKRTTHGTFEIAKDAIGNFIKKAVDKFMESFGGAVTGDHKKLMHAAGIPASWFSAIDYIVTHESGWRVNATNPSSGAYGLPQALPGSKMASAGHDWRTNPITQLKWMKEYVSSRYGGGPGAAAFWRAHHWYANGGWTDAPAIFGEVKGEPELAVNPARDSAEEHIAEAIEARAQINPNGFAGSLNKLINSAKNGQVGLVPTISDAHGNRQAIVSGGQHGTDLSGDMNVTVQVDSGVLAHYTYPKLKALREHEMIIHGVGGAIPVGRALPTGGGF